MAAGELVALENVGVLQQSSLRSWSRRTMTGQRGSDY